MKERFAELGMTILEVREHTGTYAGQIYHVKTTEGKYVYKIFDNDRRDEALIYQVIQEPFKPFIPMVALWNDAVLMTDLGDSLQMRAVCEADIIAVTETLMAIQQQVLPLPSYPLDAIEYHWLTDQLTDLQDDALTELLKPVTRYYERFNVSEFKSYFPEVVTHGDFHRGNIFVHCNVQIIDWERCSLSSPVRDMTMLLQDFANVKELRNYKDLFYTAINRFYKITYDHYNKEFNIFLLVNTVKMIVWEVSKYQQQLQSEQQLIQKIEHKLSLLRHMC